MASENVQLVRRWFDGLARGDVSPQLCHPEIEIRNWAESPTPGPYRGIEGLHRWWSDVSDAFEDVRFELEDVIELDPERVLTIQRLVGRFRLTGFAIDDAWGSVVGVRDGRVASAVGYASPGRARRAAGLQR